MNRDKQISGFSLIEMLVVIVLFAFLGIFVTQSTLQSFKGAQKADAQSKVRDNLNFAATVVERSLRNAKAIVTTCNRTSPNISYVDQNDATVSFTCDTTNKNITTTINSATSSLTSTDVVVTGCSFTCNQTGNNPPVIDFLLVGHDNTSDTDKQSEITVSRHVSLRVY